MNCVCARVCKSFTFMGYHCTNLKVSAHGTPINDAWDMDASRREKLALLIVTILLAASNAKEISTSMILAKMPRLLISFSMGLSA